MDIFDIQKQTNGLVREADEQFNKKTPALNYLSTRLPTMIDSLIKQEVKDLDRKVKRLEGEKRQGGLF